MFRFEMIIIVTTRKARLRDQIWVPNF